MIKKNKSANTYLNDNSEHSTKFSLRHRLFSFIMILSMLITIIPADTIITRAQDVLTGGTIKLELNQTEGGIIKETQRDSFYTGEPFEFTPQFEFSGPDIKIENGYVDVKIPKSKYIDAPKFVESNTAQSTKILVEGDNGYDENFYIVRYTFKVMKGGTKAAFPIPMKFKNYITPNGTKTSIEASIHQADGTVVRTIKKEVSAIATSRLVAEIFWTSAYRYTTKQHDLGVSDASATIIPNVGDVYNYIHILAINDDVTAKRNNWGIYAPKEYTIKVQMERKPDGTFYGKWGKHDYNKSWTFDPNTGIATYKGGLQFRNGFGASNFGFSWNYTGENTDIWMHSTLLSVKTDKGTQSEKDVEIRNDKVKHKYHLIQEPPGSTTAHKWKVDPRYYLYSNNKIYENRRTPVLVNNDNPIKWRLSFENWSRDYNNETQNLYVMEDFWTNVAPRNEVVPNEYNNRSLYYYSVSIKESDIEALKPYGNTQNSSKSEIVEYLKTKGYKIIGVKEDGTEETIKEKVLLDEEAIINDTSYKYQRIKFVFDENAPLKVRNAKVFFNVNTLLRNDFIEKFKNKYEELNVTQSLKIYSYNIGKAHYKTEKAGRLSDMKTFERNDYFELVTSYNRVLLDSKISETTGSGYVESFNKSFVKNPEKRYIKYKNQGWEWYSTYPADINHLNNTKMVTLLPTGVNFVRMVDENAKKPTIIPNYKNTGKTALVYELGDLDDEGLYGENNPNRREHIFDSHEMILDPTVYAEAGRNVIESYLVFDGTDQTISSDMAWGDQYINDKYDFNDNGRKDDKIIRKQNVFIYNLPKEIQTKKMISLDGKAWMFEAPRQDVGGDLYYKLTLTNEYTSPIYFLKLLDTMPYRGDHVMVEQDGVYPKRGDALGFEGSEFKTPLKQSIESLVTPENTNFLEKFDIFYSEVPAGSDMQSVYGITNWKTADQVTDWSKIKNIKFLLKEGKMIDVKESVSVVFHCQIPEDKSITVDKKAINSFSYAEGNKNIDELEAERSISYLEANEVLSRVIYYNVDGVVFRDIPNNGEVTKSKNKLSNYNVELVYAEDSEDYDENEPVSLTNHRAGDIVVEFGKKLKTITNEDGYYKFNVYKRGKYKVKFTNQNNKQVFTTQNHENTKDKQFSNLDDTTESVKDEIKSMLSTELELNPYDLVYKEDGSIDLDKGSLHAVKNAGVVENKYDLNVKKISTLEGQDFDTGAALGGVVFTLTKVTDDTFEALTGNDAYSQDKTTKSDNGKAVFDNLAFGTYKLTEKQEAQGFKKIGSVIVKISANGVSLALFDKDTSTQKLDQLANDQSRVVENSLVEIKNEPIYGVIDVIKSDALTQEKLAGVKFNLYRNNGTKANPSWEIVNDVVGANKGQPKVAITNDDGKATFNKVVLGEYKVKEVPSTVPIGYALKEESNPFELTGSAEADMVDNKVNVNYVNNRVTGTLKVTKSDADDNTKKLEGTVFTLTPKKNVTTGTPAQKQTGVVAMEVTTNAKGIATFENVPFGEYTLTEKTPPTGYNNAVINEVDANIVIDKETAKTVIAKNVTNTKIKAPIKVTKVDFDDENVKLEGVTFGLFKADENQNATGNAIETAVTNADGVATFNDVVFGKYVVKETKTLKNYELSSVEKFVNVDTNGTLIDLGMIKNKKIKGTVTITKKDIEDNTLLPGTVFTLTSKADSNVVLEATTNAQGVATFENVLYGKYTLAEKTAPVGYNKGTISEELAKVDIKTQGQTITKEVKNRKIKGTVTVTKKDAEDDTLLAGTVFTLTSKADSNVVLEATTNAQGIATFENVIYGEYTLAEKTAPVGYNKGTITEEIANVNIETEAQVIAKEVKNLKIKAPVELKKIDVDTKEAIEGVTFEIFKADENGQAVGNSVAKVLTNSEGIARFEDVIYGKYVVKETKTLENYNLSERVLPVTVTENGKLIDLGTVTNEKIKGSVSFVKVDADSLKADPNNAKPLEGVNFALAQNGKNVYEATSNAKGEVKFEDVIYGVYDLVEVTPLENYNQLAVQTGAVNINAQGIKINLGNVANQIKKGSVIVTKVDFENANKKLPGVIFGLFKFSKVNGKVVLEEKASYEATTDENGVAAFTGVIYGLYQLKEIQTLENYNLSDELTKINIDVDKKVINKTVTNKIKKAPIELKKIDVDTKEAIAGVTFEIFKADENGQAVGNSVAKVLTNANGIARFEDVIYGKYVVKETKTLENYNLSERVLPVTVTENGKLIDLGTVTNEKIKGSVNFIKVDADSLKANPNNAEPLEGVNFALAQNGKNVYEATSNAKGEVKFEDVIYGVYDLVEVTPLENYNKLDVVKGAVDIKTNGQKLDLGKIANQIKKGSVKVTKVDFEDANKKLPGVIFGLFKFKEDNGQIILDTKASYEATTDENGVATFTGVIYGLYQLKEISTLENYNLSDELTKINIDADKKVINKTVTNKIKKAPIIITKTDVDTKEAIEGVTFGLFEKDGVTPVKNSLKKDENFVAVTDKNGIARFEDVVYGEYVVREIKTLENYVLDNTPIEVIIRDNGVAIEKFMTNIKKKANVTLTKVDAEDNSKTLSNVKFGLFQNDKKLYEVITDENGKATFENVIYGDYKLKELETHKNYNLLKDGLDVSVKEDGKTVDIGNIENKIIKGNIVITKVDSKDNKKLSGVSFGLFEKDGITPVKNPLKPDEDFVVITDENGVANFKDIVYGDYVVKEIKAKDGYKLNDKEIKFAVRENGKDYKALVTNDKIIKPKKVTTTNTGDNTNIQLYLMLMLISTLLVVSIMTKKKFSNK